MSRAKTCTKLESLLGEDAAAADAEDAEVRTSPSTPAFAAAPAGGACELEEDHEGTAAAPAAGGGGLLLLLCSGGFCAGLLLLL
mmetsp:Transcript_24169/g.81544  ORF Transcript_24169/g.81544 Transcript_24169/m.81544 type:complete len:84 (-) Transcript_24169:294-545(-)